MHFKSSLASSNAQRLKTTFELAVDESEIENWIFVAWINWQSVRKLFFILVYSFRLLCEGSKFQPILLYILFKFIEINKSIGVAYRVFVKNVCIECAVCPILSCSLYSNGNEEFFFSVSILNFYLWYISIIHFACIKNRLRYNNRIA